MGEPMATVRSFDSDYRVQSYRVDFYGQETALKALRTSCTGVICRMDVWI